MEDDIFEIEHPNTRVFVSVRWFRLVWLRFLRVFLLLGDKLVRQFRGCGSPRRLSFILLPPAPNKPPSDDPEESEAGRKRCAPALQNPFRLEVGFGVEREHCLRSLRTRATSADPKPEASRHAPRDRPAPFRLVDSQLARRGAGMQRRAIV